MDSKPKIYLLGANNRATATLAKVYKKNNYTVYVISWHQNNIRYSKFVDHFILLPDVEENVEAFKSGFINFFSTREGLLIPVNDIAVLICLQCAAELHDKIKITGVNTAAIQQFAINKYTLLQLVLSCNIDCPATKYITTINEFNELSNSLVFPIVARPVSSKLISDNAVLSFSVKKFDTLDSVTDFVRENINTIPIMLQECLEEGYGIGFNFIAQKGELIDYYFHQRIHEAWGGGESSYRKTITDDLYGLVPKASLLIKLMGWNGVGMLEFRVSNNKAYLMELNGRFWGSIQLGVFAGKNFPSQLLDIGSLLNKDTAIIKKEFYARNLKMELTWLLQGVFNRKKFGLPFVWLWNVRKSFNANETIEDNLFADFKYRVLDIVDLISMPIRKGIERYKINKKSTIVWNTVSGQRYLPKQGDHIAFICKGNICRSPFAEMYAQRHFPGYTFYSTGFINKSNRLPPLAAATAAKKYGTDVSSHKSSNIYLLEKEKMNAWFVMDKENLWSLINTMPKIDTRKIFSLGGIHEITDPFNKDAVSFDTTFFKISAQLNSLFKMDNNTT